MTRDPRLRALAEALRSPETEERTSALSALPPSTSPGVWIGVLIADASLRVRDVATERLAQRSAAAQAALPAPQGPLNATRRERLFQALAHDLGFLTILLAYPRGQHLLGLAPLERCAVDDGLLDLAAQASPQELRELLALPVDLSGRGLELFRALPQRAEAERAAFLEQLTWQCLQDLGPDGRELDRAQEALGAWVEGLASLGPAAPPFVTWLAEGGELQRGPVTHRFQAPSAPVLEALAPLARLFELLFGADSTTTWRAPEELADELASPLAELRVLAWQRLLEADLVDADRAVETLGAEVPGAVVALLESLHGRLTPKHAGVLRELAVHPRASVREALARALASQPLVAALVAAGVDPRSPDASLGILAAQPPELADAALAAYLEVERAPELLAQALGALREPPSSGWAQWPTLLAHEAPRVRGAAAAALVTLPPREAPGLRALWPALREASPAAALEALVRYDLPAPAELLEATLLRPRTSAREVAAGLALLRARPSWSHQLAAWRFVVGRGARERFGTRDQRRQALDALAALDDAARPQNQAQGDPEWLGGQATALAPAALGALLADRDPFQLGLALRYAMRRGLPAALLDRVGELCHGVLSQLRLSRRARRWRAFWARGCLRWILPRRWVSPAGRFRDGAALERLAAGLFDLARVWGLRLAWPEDLRPLRARAGRLGSAARQLYVAQSEAPLAELLADADLAEEAVRTRHPDQVEAQVLDAFDRRPATALRWARLRPRAAYAPALREPLRRGAAGSDEALLALAAHGAEAEARGLVEELLQQALEARDPRTLDRSLSLVEALDARELLPQALPALAWASEGPRRRLVAALKAAVAAGGDDLDPRGLEVALRHPVQEVRALGVSLARALPERVDAFALVRGAGPGGAKLPTEVAKPWVGLCEDRYRIDMGLALELLLEHPSGEVARRALKLINRREQTVAAVALLERVGDPELRAPVQATFSRWAAGSFDAATRDDPELLEEARRVLRAELLVLAEGHPRTEAVEAALASEVALLRVAGFAALGRLGLQELEGAIDAGLQDPDLAVLRAAALAAGQLPAAPRWQPRLETLASHPLAEVRLAARGALLAHLGEAAETAGQRDALLTDRSPEVRLLLLRRGRNTGDLYLSARLGDPDPRVRVAALQLLIHGPPGDPGVLRGVLRDPVPEVRAAALQVVARWGDPGAVRAELAERLADPALDVQAAALELVASCAPGEEVAS